jgi:hypothetical protein
MGLIIIIWVLLGLDLVLENLEEVRRVKSVGAQVLAVILLGLGAPLFLASGLLISALEELGMENWKDG